MSDEWGKRRRMKQSAKRSGPASTLDNPPENDADPSASPAAVGTRTHHSSLITHYSLLAKRKLTQLTHHIHTLPIVVLMPHSRCNCRCVMCDIWKSNHLKREISREDLLRHMGDFERLGVRRVVLSGGEALMHSNLW